MLDPSEWLWQCEFDAEIIKLQAKKLIADKDHFLETLDDMENRAACHILTQTEFKAWLQRIQQEPAYANCF